MKDKTFLSISQKYTSNAWFYKCLILQRLSSASLYKPLLDIHDVICIILNLYWIKCWLETLYSIHNIKLFVNWPESFLSISLTLCVGRNIGIICYKKSPTQQQSIKILFKNFHTPCCRISNISNIFSFKHCALPQMQGRDFDENCVSEE